MAEKVCLEELFDIGSSKRVFQSEWRDKGVPFYRAREIAKLAANGYVDNELFIEEELYNKYIEQYGKPEAGDIMITGVGTLGVCYIVKDNDKFYFKDGNILWFHQKAKERVLSEYVVKAFNSRAIRDQIQRNSSGTTVGTFTIQTAKKMMIELPSVTEQKQIVNKLCKIESIIADRKMQIQLLDELIKSRFIEMFGDTISNNMNWQIKQLQEVGEWKSGGTPSRTNKEYFKGDIDWYSAGELNELYLEESIEKITQEAIDKSSAKMFYKGSMLVGMYDTAAFKMGILKKDSASNQACANVMPNEKVNIVWLCYNLMHMKEYFLSNRRGIRQKNLNLGMIKEFQIPVPPIELQNQFATFVQQVDKQKVILQQSLTELETQFQALMQEAFKA